MSHPETEITSRPTESQVADIRLICIRRPAERRRPSGSTQPEELLQPGHVTTVHVVKNVLITVKGVYCLVHAQDGGLDQREVSVQPAGILF